MLPTWKIEQFKKYLEKNEDTLNILSKHQNWITVSPKTMDRNHPLEKIRHGLHEVSNVAPIWMDIASRRNNNNIIIIL